MVDLRQQCFVGWEDEGQQVSKCCSLAFVAPQKWVDRSTLKTSVTTLSRNFKHVASSGMSIYFELILETVVKLNFLYLHGYMVNLEDNAYRSRCSEEELFIDKVSRIRLCRRSISMMLEKAISHAFMK